MVTNALEDQTAATSFEDKINDRKEIWQDEEAERQEQAQADAIAEAIAEDPNANPDEVVAVQVTPRTFLCHRTLERCLNKVVKDILPTDAVLQ